MLIKEVKACVIKDSRGDETICVSVNGCVEASSPNGKSTGKYETKSYYKSLKFCVGFLNDWKEEIEVNKFQDLYKVERAVCKKIGLKNALEFGANSLYAFESAILKALVKEKKKELFEIVGNNNKMPTPIGNVVGGGLHSTAIKIHPNFQEFLVIPKSKRFSDNLKIMNYVYSKLKESLSPHGVNDEGAWLVSSIDEEVLDELNKVKINAEKKFGVEVQIGIDAATSALFKNKKYIYNQKNFEFGFLDDRSADLKKHYRHNKQINSSAQSVFIEKLILNYDLGYVEDPFEERDFKNFAKLQKALGKNCMIVGDDLTASQYARIVGAIKTKSINAMIIKPNQNGSLLELKRIFLLCRKHGIKTVLSHRSGETLDNALADYAVGFGADYIKCGVATKWREAKLKRLGEIEKKLR